MSSPALEILLARLYTDATLLERFIADPAAVAATAGLSDAEIVALIGSDLTGLRMAADSYAHKRARHRRPGRFPASWLGRRLRRWRFWCGWHLGA
jgi:hypothetical protein